MNYLDIEELGLLKISGSQNADFLQGQLTCDVREVTANQICLAAHCNFKGRVLATGWLFYITPDYYLLMMKSLVPVLLKDLSKYAAFYQLNVEDSSESMPKIGLSGSNLATEIRRLFSLDALEANRVYTFNQSYLLMLDGAVPRAVIIGQLPKVHHISHQSTKTFESWEMVDIKSGIAQVSCQTRGLFTPHHLNYHKNHGINFNKGCYTGQEVIARMHYLGKLTQSLYQFSIKNTALPSKGDPIFDAESKHQGTVVTAAVDSTDCGATLYQGLAVMRDASMATYLYLNNHPICDLKKL